MLLNILYFITHWAFIQANSTGSAENNYFAAKNQSL